MEFLGASGHGLTVQEQAGLEVAMLYIQQSEKLDRGALAFWGKVTGDANDYLVCAATMPHYPFPAKKFYYTTVTKPETLQAVPDLTKEYGEHAAKLVQKPLVGDPAFPYPLPVAEGVEPPEPVVDANGDEVQPEVFREEHRLAFAVALIDHDCNVVPRGAYLVDAAHRVIRNGGFTGLGYEAAGMLTSYYHFRAPESEHCMMALEKPGIVRASEFLDPISADKPSGCFSLAYTASKTLATVRSFSWPGAFFYHVISTATYGNVYFGDGTPNTDIQFML